MKITKQKFKQDYLDKLIEERGLEIIEASNLDKYIALSTLIRDYTAKNWIRTSNKYIKIEKRQIYYFSMEFLLGKFLINNLINLGIKDICERALRELGVDLNEMNKIENDQGLGNGGLGRLAACFLDSMATTNIPGHGCGMRYKYGLFEQKIIDGYQVEFPDKWLQYDNVWEIKKQEKAVEIRFGGEIKSIDDNGNFKFIHENFEKVLAVPYDTPIVGYKNNLVNTLRLWSAEDVVTEFSFDEFNKGEYVKAFNQKHSAESISQVLYPNDAFEHGKILRLKQEYFFVSAGIQSIIRTFKKLKKPISELYKYVAIHINDTHPALCVPELMRILIDDENIGWDDAWYITKNTISYTNHTIMSEALEKWSINIFKDLLPRMYMIVDEINERFCKFLWEDKKIHDFDKISKMAIIGDNYVRMAHLAIVGSYSVNGVAYLHTEILKNQELKDFYDIYPHKFSNKTNGISHRRWLLKSNSRLSQLVNETIGKEWIDNPENLIKLLDYRDDTSFQDKIYRIKQYNKKKLAKMIKDKYSITIDINSIFDIQAKRIHEYKRQMLNLLNIMNLYNKLLDNPDLDIIPRTFIFSGKAAPGYYAAKQIIKLINTIASKINNDERIKNKIKVVFIENYGVSLAELIIPAADVSEQIATTTKEASGTGNMKFMMNGAITIATLDGANVEIEREVGNENIVIFGLKEKDIIELYKNKTYKSIDIYNSDLRLKRILDSLIDGSLSHREDEFMGIYDSLLKYNDEYFVLKDFDEYVNAQDKIDQLFRNKSEWQEMCIINIAHSGTFSSDKTISEYNNEIWKS